MLHGLGGLVFSGLHAALAKKYRVIALEMPGFGQSAPNDRSRSVPDLAQTVSQAVANLGVDRYSLVGSSFGGRVALWLALQSASAVDLLALLSPTAVLPEGYTPLASASEPSAHLMFAHPERAPAPLAVDPAVAAREEALLRRIRGDRQDPELEARLAEVATPTLVVFGTADRVVPAAMGRTYRERIPNCHYVLVYDAGHAVAEERPEAVANVVTDFLEFRETFVVGRRDGRINP
jgi:pimeloyl-ACP methyl ester carboxylesterase